MSPEVGADREVDEIRLSPGQCAALARQIWYAHFPQHCADISILPGNLFQRLVIRWQDGPSEAQVTKLFAPLVGIYYSMRRFEVMARIMLFDGQHTHFEISDVSLDRRLSTGFLQCGLDAYLAAHPYDTHPQSSLLTARTLRTHKNRVIDDPDGADLPFRQALIAWADHRHPVVAKPCLSWDKLTPVSERSIDLPPGKAAELRTLMLLSLDTHGDA